MKNGIFKTCFVIVCFWFAFVFILAVQAAVQGSELVLASQTSQTLGVSGAIGDKIKAMVCSVGTAASSGVTIQDGSSSAQSIIEDGAAIGPYTIEFPYRGLESTNGAWKVSTSAGVFCHAFGEFEE